MGLGLTLVRRLCELLGGSIVVESAPARGTRVALRFPVTTSVPQNVVAEELRLSA
jgi:signal transduction histidine kinase